MNRPRRRPRGRLPPRLPAAPAPVGVAAEAGEEATHGSGLWRSVREKEDLISWNLKGMFGVAGWLWIRGESDRCLGVEASQGAEVVALVGVCWRVSI